MCKTALHYYCSLVWFKYCHRKIQHIEIVTTKYIVKVIYDQLGSVIVILADPAWPLRFILTIGSHLKVNIESTVWRWRGGVVVRASDLQPIGRRLESRLLRFTNDSGQVVHTHVPLFTKRYKLVPANGRWCSMAKKVTVGLASHWSCVTVSVLWLNGLGKGDEYSEYYGICTF